MISDVQAKILSTAVQDSRGMVDDSQFPGSALLRLRGDDLRCLRFVGQLLTHVYDGTLHVSLLYEITMAGRGELQEWEKANAGK